MIGKEGVAVKSLVDSQPTKERCWFRQTSFPQDQSAAHYHHHHPHCCRCDTFDQIFVSTKNLNFVKSFLSFSILCRSSTFFAGRAGSQFCQHITLLNFPLLNFPLLIFPILIFVPSLRFIFIEHSGIFYRGQTGFGRFWDSSEIQCNFRSAAFKNFSLTYLAGWRGNIELAVKYETTFDRTLFLSIVFKIFLRVANRHKSGLICRRWNSILTRPIWNMEYKYFVRI